MARLAIRNVIWVLLLMGVWMLFVVTTELPDIALGAGSAVFTAILVAFIRRASGHQIAGRARWLAATTPLIPRLFTDTAKVFAALFRQLFLGQPVRGAFRALPYRGVYENEAHASAGDAFVIATNSFTPNTIVLDIDRVEGLAIVHQLVPQPYETANQQFVRAG